jgi:hypothetical protein
MTKYYGNMVNLGGLYSKKPIVCSKESVELGTYWDSSGDFDIDPKKLGLTTEDGLIKFTSKNKQDVEFWTMGALSVMTQLKRWAYLGEK